jgi:hypothetical protein
LEPGLAEKLVEAADREAKSLTAEADRKQAEKELAQQTKTLNAAHREGEQ